MKPTVKNGTNFYPCLMIGGPMNGKTVRVPKAARYVNQQPFEAYSEDGDLLANLTDSTDGWHEEVTYDVYRVQLDGGYYQRFALERVARQPLTAEQAWAFFSELVTREPV